MGLCEQPVTPLPPLKGVPLKYETQAQMRGTCGGKMYDMRYIFHGQKKDSIVRFVTRVRINELVLSLGTNK